MHIVDPDVSRFIISSIQRRDLDRADSIAGRGRTSPSWKISEKDRWREAGKYVAMVSRKNQPASQKNVQFVAFLNTNLEMLRNCDSIVHLTEQRTMFAHMHKHINT